MFGFDGTLTLTTYSGCNRIYESAFRNCSSLTGDLVIPDNIKYIEFNAFQNCSNFNGTLTLSNNLHEIRSYAFQNCTNFTGELVIPDNIDFIEQYVFDNCIGFSSLRFAGRLNKIKGMAFLNCTGLKGKLVLPETLIELADKAFFGCTGITELELPANLPTIGTSAFRGCTGLTGTLVIPEGEMTTIGGSAFLGCTNITNISIPNTIKEIKGSAFEDCTGLVGPIILPNSITKLDDDMFNNCINLSGKIVIPESVTTIGYEVFNNCSKVEEFVLNDNITDINWYAFRNCTNAKINIPKSLKKTSTETFYGCKELKGDLILPSSLTTLGNRCFANTGISGVIIPADVNISSFGVGAFANNENLQWVMLLADTPPTYLNEFTTLDDTGGGMQLSANYPVYVHSQAEKDYKATVPDYDKIYPILAVDDVELTVNGSAVVTYKYQPELTEETHQAILQLTPAHKGESIEWSAADVEATQNAAQKAARNAEVTTMDAGSSIISFEPSTLTVKALSAGTANIIANDGVNKAVATVNVSAQPEEECDCCQPGDSDAQIRDRIYMIPDENMDLTQLLGELAASSWTTTDDAVVTVSDAGEAHALQYGEVYVRAKDVDDKTLAVIMISVCPTITVEHGAGVVYAHHVPYNTRPTLLVAPGGGYKISGITHDGEDINSELVASDGKYVPEKPITANSVINLSLEEDPSSGPTTHAASVMSDSDIRIYVNGHNVRIVGAQLGSVVVMTNLEGKELFRAKRYDVDVIDAGVYVITVEGHPSPFKILVR